MTPRSLSRNLLPVVTALNRIGCRFEAQKVIPLYYSRTTVCRKNCTHAIQSHQQHSQRSPALRSCHQPKPFHKRRECPACGPWRNCRCRNRSCSTLLDTQRPRMAFLHIGPYGRSGLRMWAYRQRRISCDPSRVAITLSLTLTHVDALGDAGSHKVRHPLQKGKKEDSLRPYASFRNGSAEGGYVPIPIATSHPGCKTQPLCASHPPGNLLYTSGRLRLAIDSQRQT